jgi:hypothetical protein
MLPAINYQNKIVFRAVFGAGWRNRRLRGLRSVDKSSILKEIAGNFGKND